MRHKNQDACVTTEADTDDPEELEILQRLWYYPFGMSMQGLSSCTTNPDQCYRYNGKERDTLSGWTDFGARWGILEIGRWNGVDPLAASYYGWSPFCFTLDNPVQLVDPDGRAPEWKPRVISGGRIQLVAEQGDNLQTLKSYLGGSTRFSYAQIEELYNSAQGGVIVNLPEDNYSRAMNYSNKYPNEFYELRELSDMSYDEKIETSNYNCYHFALNGVWEKEIYSKENGSFGSFIMEATDFLPILEKYFTEVPADKAIYGETIITMSQNGKYPMHVAVYAGKDQKGNIYIMDKFGGHLAPSLRKLSETEREDFKFYNEN